MSFLLDFKDRIMEDAAIDDSIDRASRQYTVIFFLIILIFLGLKQFVGDPIECFTPQYFSGAQESYVNAYCWTASTYQVMDREYNPFRSFKNTDVILKGAGTRVDEQPFGDSELKGVKHYVSYYQWIPIIIAVQAFLFYAPHLIWAGLATNSGIHIKTLLTGARDLGKVQGKKQEREDLLEDLVEQFNRYIKVTKKLSNKSCCMPTQKTMGIGKKNGNYLCFLYLMVKLIYFANCLGQLYGLHLFLNTNLVVHGFNVLKGIVFNSDWTESPRFPINTICEFRGQPQLHGYLLSYTCHCVLPINLYNDKIYAIVSLYMLTLVILTGISFGIWINRIVNPQTRTKFIKHYLAVNNKPSEFDKTTFNSMWRQFTERRLRPDGIFILMLVDVNLGGIITDQFVVKLWDNFVKDFENEKKKKEALDDEETLPFSTIPKPLSNPNGHAKKYSLPNYPDLQGAQHPSAPRYNGMDVPNSAVAVNMPL